MCTHNVLEQNYYNKKKIVFFSFMKLSIFLLNFIKNSLYIAWAIFRNEIYGEQGGILVVDHQTLNLVDMGLNHTGVTF